jgi:membrane protease YdiL (CAAX protease family)
MEGLAMSAIITSATESGVGIRAFVKRHPLLVYFIIAFLGTWLMILPLALSQEGSGLFPYTLPALVTMLIFFGAAYAGPLLAALVVTAIESGRPGVRELLWRIVLLRVGLQWYLVALFIFLAIFLVAYNLALRGVLLENLIQNWGMIFSVFLPNVALGLLFPSLGEEPGWRGFALPRLQAGYGPLMGSLILGLFHSLWHLPAFFTPYLGPFTPARFLAFALAGIAGTYVYTWIYNHTRASILIAMLVHAASNAASTFLGRLIPVDAPLAPWAEALGGDWINVIAFGTAAVLLVLVTKGRLGYKPEA